MPVSSVLSKDASVTMRGRDDVPPGFPEVLCLNPVATVRLHGTPWLEPTPLGTPDTIGP